MVQQHDEIDSFLTDDGVLAEAVVAFDGEIDFGLRRHQYREGFVPFRLCCRFHRFRFERIFLIDGDLDVRCRFYEVAGTQVSALN